VELKGEGKEGDLLVVSPTRSWEIISWVRRKK